MGNALGGLGDPLALGRDARNADQALQVGERLLQMIGDVAVNLVVRHGHDGGSFGSYGTLGGWCVPSKSISEPYSGFRNYLYRSAVSVPASATCFRYLFRVSNSPFM